MKTAAIGRTNVLLRTIRTIVSHGHEVSLVVTTDPAEFYAADVSDFQSITDDVDATFVRTDDVNDGAIRSRVEDENIQVGVSVNWKELIGDRLIDAFEHGILNYHAGDLPRYRGNAAMNWALINGEQAVTHTLHFMTRELDAGPIARQRRMPISRETRLADIYRFAEDHVPKMVTEVLDDLEAGSLEPRPQSDDPEDVLRCFPRRPEDSKLNWERSAEHLDRIVRASSEPLFGAYTYFQGQKLRVWRAHAEYPEFEWLGTPGQIADRRPDTGDVAVCTGEGFLVLETVEPEDGKRQSAADWITSARARLGHDRDSEISRLRERIAQLESKIEDS